MLWEIKYNSVLKIIFLSQSAIFKSILRRLKAQLRKRTYLYSVSNRHIGHHLYVMETGFRVFEKKGGNLPWKKGEIFPRTIIFFSKVFQKKSLAQILLMPEYIFFDLLYLIWTSKRLLWKVIFSLFGWKIINHARAAEQTTKRRPNCTESS